MILYNRNPYISLDVYNGNLRCTIKNSSGSNTTISYATSNFNAYNWYHISYVLNGTSSIFELYVNGLRVGAATAPSTILNVASTGYLGHGGGYQYWNGKIDQVRIFSTALDSDQVSQLYNEKPCADTSNFKTVLYTGNGNDNRYISNLGIDLETSGGLVWTKTRTAAYYHQLQDSVREAGANAIYSNSTDAENGGSSTYNTDFGYINSFEANGWFTKNGSDGLGTWVNKSGEDYVAWVWKGGGDAVSNTDGVTSGSVTAVTSTVSANQDAGFSINKFTTPSSGFPSWGHGLSESPELIILKATGLTQNWIVYAPSILGQKDGNLNTTAAFTSYSPDIISVDGSKIDLGRSGYGLSGSSDYIAYCFHSVSGISSIGTYSGNSNTQTIVTGFEPSFVMIKTINTVSNWVIFDNKRPNEYLMPSLPNAGNTQTDMVTGFVSNGFTLGADASTAAVNSSAANYLYMAFK
jgi:hypothetical protein